MFLKWAIRRNQQDERAELRAEVSALRAEVSALRAEVEDIKRGGTYVNEDGDKVPMSQVLNEYLYGAKEGDA
jgi:cell division protein FtsB